MNKILLALAGAVILAAFLSQTFAREEGKSPPAYNEKAGHRQEKAFFMTEIKPGVFINQAVVDYLKGGGLCTANPSCGAFHVLSTEKCDVIEKEMEANGNANALGDEDVFTGECYICSIDTELKAKMKCPDGWGTDYGGFKAPFYNEVPSIMSKLFLCDSRCKVKCSYEYSVLNKGTDKDYGDCLLGCPDASSVKDSCPKGFTFVPRKVLLNEKEKYLYFECLFPGVSEVEKIQYPKTPICTQCNSLSYGVDSASGDVICGIKK